MAWIIPIIFLAAALLEVCGDAIVRSGLRGNQPLAVALGCLLLAAYGVMVIWVLWDFARLLGVYVAVSLASGPEKPRTAASA